MGLGGAHRRDGEVKDCGWNWDQVRIDCGRELQRLLVLVSLLAPTYNVARGEFVIRETEREIRPTRKLSGFFVFLGRREVNSQQFKVESEKKEGKSFNAEGTELRAQRARRCCVGLNPMMGDGAMITSMRLHATDKRS